MVFRYDLTLTGLLCKVKVKNQCSADREKGDKKHEMCLLFISLAFSTSDFYIPLASEGKEDIMIMQRKA